VDELWCRPPRREDYAFTGTRRWFSVRNAFLLLDRVLKLAGRSPVKPLRRHAIRRAVEWILARQDVNGGWGGIQPPMLNCVMALKALGFADDHPAVANGIRAIDDFLVEHEGQLLFQPCVSPTWDTALAMKALLDSGVRSAHPALVRAAEWLLARQIFRPGDWSVRNPALEPGGWAFEFANDWYPDTDDTAVILMVLDRVPVPDTAAKRRAMAYGTNWVLGMQSRNGGWGAFDTDNDSAWLNEIPFADMRAMIDPPTEDLTGRLLELMGTQGFDARFGRVRGALDFVRRTQRPGGAWWGRWGANFVYGTWSVLAGLEAVGEDMRAPYVRRAVHWLESIQNPDGGFGETLASYDDESQAGVGPSTPSQTAWAALGLIAAEERPTPAIERAIEHLLDTQRPDGGWDEEPFTGTGFPGHFYLRYWMYRDYFPLMALGRYRTLLSRAAAT
jgi:squalene-hopene/tetraprenyl-beta-curcumene cyclase